MKRLALLAAALIAAPAIAQPLTETTVNDTIRFQPGEVRVMTFDKSVGKLDIPEDIIQVSPESDRTFRFRAVRSGATLMSAFSPEGALIHRSHIVVSGGLVRIYGGSKDDTKDYVGYLCSESGCGRADPELDKPNTVETTRRNSRGDIITTIRNR